jgi:hypothetical protein
MKPPQERSTPIRLTDYTRITATDEFRIQTKYTHKGYTTWLNTADKKAVKVFRDLVEYVLASITDKTPPERYKDYKPLSERKRVFSEGHDGFNNHDDEMRIQVKQIEEPTTLRRKSDRTHNGPKTIEFNDINEMKNLVEACESWLSHESNEKDLAK